MQKFGPKMRKELEAFASVMMAIPALVFYYILWKTAVRIPIADDYDIVLRLANWLHDHRWFPARFFFLLTTEHNGYKLLFENLVVYGQYTILGSVHFAALVALGDAFPLLIFLVVIYMSRGASTPISSRSLLLLAPVAYLTFQLQYASALNFASSSLQHLAVIFFSLLAISLLGNGGIRAFGAACAGLILAIAASPNGFFAGAAGLLLLVQGKEWRRSFIWVGTVIGMLLIYLYRYTGPSPAAASQDVTAGGLSHPHLLYALSFLGASGAQYSSTAPSLALGIVLLCVIALAAQRRYFRQNPPVFYSMLFILFNAIGVSALRSDLGVTQSLASRYRTYSNLLLVFSYVFIIESFFSNWKSQRVRRSFYLTALAFSVAFCCLSDIAGEHFLRGKKDALILCYRTQWQAERETGGVVEGPPNANPALIRQIDSGIYNVNLPVLREAAGKGTYIPPENP